MYVRRDVRRRVRQKAGGVCVGGCYRGDSLGAIHILRDFGDGLVRTDFLRDYRGSDADAGSGGYAGGGNDCFLDFGGLYALGVYGFAVADVDL